MLVLVALLSGCAGSSSAKLLDTVDGQQVWSIRCQRNAACWDRAEDVCGGSYELYSTERYSTGAVATTYSSGNTTRTRVRPTSKRRAMVICDRVVDCADEQDCQSQPDAASANP